MKVIQFEQDPMQRAANLLTIVNTLRVFNQDIHSVKQETREQELEYLKLAAGSRANNTLCGIQLKQMLAQAKELDQLVASRRIIDKQTGGNNKQQVQPKPMHERYIRLAQVLDSFGRYDSGLLLGRNSYTGSYKQCEETYLLLDSLNSKQKTRTRYCSAKFDMRKFAYSNLQRREALSHEAPPILETGICLPDSCHTIGYEDNKQLLAQLVDSQFSLPPSLFQDEHLELMDVFCSLDETSAFSRLPFSGKLFISLMSMWFILIIYATIYTYKHYKLEASKQEQQQSNELEAKRIKKRRSKLSQALELVSLQQSWYDFTSKSSSEDTAEDRINLNTLNPVKVFGCAFVILGHGLMLELAPAIDLTRALGMADSDTFLLAIAGGTVIVDTFFVITGILLTYTRLKRITEEPKMALAAKQQVPLLAQAKYYLSHMLQFVAGRYLRILPLYFLAFWFKRSVFPYIRNGPYWDYGLNINTIVGACKQESWFSIASFGASTLPLARQCVPHTWSVASDLFFVLILAPMVLIIWYKPKIAAIITIAICAGSNYSMVSAFNTMKPSVLSILETNRFHAIIEVFTQMSYVYTWPVYRMFSTLIGAFMGYALFQYKQKVINKWPHWFTGFATKFSIFTVIISIIGFPLVPVMQQTIFKLVPIEKYFFVNSMTSSRLLWATSNAILLARFATDWKNHPIVRVAGDKFWSALAKLNFLILLLHIDFIHYQVQSRLSSQYFSRYHIVTTFGSVYFFCLSTALVLHFFIENPVNKIVKVFTDGPIRVAGCCEGSAEKLQESDKKHD